MKNVFLVLFIIFVKSVAQKQPQVLNNLKEVNGFSSVQVEKIFNHLQEVPNHSNISIAVVNENTTLYYGVYKDDNRLTTIPNKNTVYEIGSLTKIFTSNILAQLYIDRKIQRLNDPINKYYKRSFANHEFISFLSLANHTSGLPTIPSNLKLSKNRDLNPFKSYDKYAFYDYIYKGMRFEYTPETHMQYSHIGTALLGITLCKIEQKSYETLLQQYIVGPLKMKSTSTIRSKVQGKLVQGLNAKGKPVANWDFNIFVSSGGMLSSTADLSQFVKSQFIKPSKASLMTHEITYQVGQKAAGLGWVYSLNEGKPLLFQNGTSGGYQSTMVIDKKSKTGVVILANCSLVNTTKGNILDELALELLSSFDGLSNDGEVGFVYK